MDKSSFREIVDRAIQREEGAYELYANCAERATKAITKEFFLDLAEEEKEHAKLLEKLTLRKIKKFNDKQVKELMMSDFLVKLKFTSDMDPQDVLVFAIKLEGDAIDFYSGLTEATDDPEARKLFSFFAKEEVKHKKNLEEAYENQYYQFF